jgi:hypothetical protein
MAHVTAQQRGQSQLSTLHVYGGHTRFGTARRAALIERTAYQGGPRSHAAVTLILGPGRHAENFGNSSRSSPRRPADVRAMMRTDLLRGRYGTCVLVAEMAGE